jgi:hypothetical protein
LLGAVRGYPDQALFHGFPRDASWCRAQLQPGDLGSLRYGRFDNWKTLTGGSRAVADGAARIAASEPSAAASRDAENVKAVAEAVRGGVKYPELIAAQAEDGSLILMEGNTRATAYALAEVGEPIEMFVASSPSMRAWYWY